MLTSTVANGVATFTPSASLPYNSTCSYTGTVTAKGDGAGKPATVGWTTMFQTEARPVLHYANVIFGMAADNGFYPMKLEGSTCASMKVTAARNDTKFQTGFFPLFNGWMLNAPQASGRILVAAQAPSDGNRRNGVILDPVANVLSDYNGEEGAVPSMDEQNPDPRWINTSVADNPDPAIGGYADTPTMLVYVTRVAGDVLLCKEKATGVVTEVSRTSGGWKAFIVYSNN